MPVSYTHLDVYKRQHLYLSHDGKTEKAKNGLMPFFEELVQWIEENCDARKVNFIAVSYTHLDVYKRQGCDGIFATM